MKIMEVNILTSFIAGLISFLSPCVFPLVPAYISYISGISIRDISSSKISINTIFNLISFIIGFSIIFILFGASATFIGQLLAQNKLLISKFASLIIIVFGLQFMGILRLKKGYQFNSTLRTFFWLTLILFVILLYNFFQGWLFLTISILLVLVFNYFNLISFEFLNYEKKLNVNVGKASIISSFILGSSFAFGWTPCIGPILASILTLAAMQDTIYKGIILLSFYSLGLAIPFFIAGILTDLILRSSRRIKKFFGVIEVLAGLLLIVIGILIYADMFIILASFGAKF